jgi:hypothetical protein
MDIVQWSHSHSFSTLERDTMKKFVIGYVNFYDNNLILELIEAESEHQARWQHSSLQSADWEGCNQDTHQMTPDEFQQWCFDCDMLISSIEIP